MLESKLSHLVDPLREMIYQYDMVIGRFREESGARVAGLTCDMLPAEITAALGLVPLRVPSLMAGCCTAEAISDMRGVESVYDLIVVPRGCTGRHRIPAALNIHELACPAGWGEQSWRAMEDGLEGLLERAGCPGLSRLDPAVLAAVTAGYNGVRRMVRGILSARREKPDLLSCRDLAVVMETAMVFPPTVASGLLAPVLEGINRAESRAVAGMVPVMVYGSFTGDAAVLDEIEEAGCLVVEDDTCGGRRQFDMSYNAEAEDLYHEILDAFSYRPRCPSVRTIEERVALLYSMIKSHGMEMVILIGDMSCPARKRDIDALRVRLMRSGVDPLVVTSGDAAEKVREYVRRM